MPTRQGKNLLQLGINAHPFPIPAKVLIGDDAVNLGKKSIILSHADIFSGMNASAQLSDQNIARLDHLAAESFYTTALALTISTIAGTSASFFMCQESNLRLFHHQRCQALISRQARG
jgi:hypothetical protein